MADPSTPGIIRSQRITSYVCTSSSFTSPSAPPHAATISWGGLRMRRYARRTAGSSSMTSTRAGLVGAGLELGGISVGSHHPPKNVADLLLRAVRLGGQDHGRHQVGPARRRLAYSIEARLRRRDRKS